ncbi:unnamed protein product [Cutaneotrichosporon oleaginosum]
MQSALAKDTVPPSATSAGASAMRALPGPGSGLCLWPAHHRRNPGARMISLSASNPCDARARCVRKTNPPGEWPRKSNAPLKHKRDHSYAQDVRTAEPEEIFWVGACSPRALKTQLADHRTIGSTELKLSGRRPRNQDEFRRPP